MTKIEEAAKAQQDALAEIFASQKPWDDLSLPEQAARVVAQRAAVQVLRVSDDAMIASVAGPGLEPHVAEWIYQTMIDTIL